MQKGEISTRSFRLNLFSPYFYSMDGCDGLPIGAAANSTLNMSVLENGGLGLNTVLLVEFAHLGTFEVCKCEIYFNIFRA